MSAGHYRGCLKRFVKVDSNGWMKKLALGGSLQKAKSYAEALKRQTFAADFNMMHHNTNL